MSKGSRRQPVGWRGQDGDSSSSSKAGWWGLAVGRGLIRHRQHGCWFKLYLRLHWPQPLLMHSSTGVYGVTLQTAAMTAPCSSRGECIATLQDPFDDLEASTFVSRVPSKVIVDMMGLKRKSLCDFKGLKVYTLVHLRTCVLLSACKMR
jgi:hypothetical protein